MDDDLDRTPQPPPDGGAPRTPQPLPDGGAPRTPQPPSDGGAPRTPQPLPDGGAPRTPQPPSDGGVPRTSQSPSDGGVPGPGQVLDYDELLQALNTDRTSLLRQRARAALSRIASGRRELPAVRHPLGFLCLPLLRDGDRGICVHLFEGGLDPEPDAAPVHAHSWDLSSHVLYGQVVNVRVRTTDGGARPTHRVFEIRSDPDGIDEIRPTSLLVRSSPAARLTSSGGESYTLPAGEFHTTLVPAHRPTATLVLGLARPGGMDLSLGPLDGRAGRTVRRLYDRGQTVKTVRTALGRMADG
ncbi:hypothetical protein [Streptomyces sp. NPDC058657]|uniref:hypothetical protein n=1 Tax=unclassified Streptomyces TaxID=2593676 RepID=UPI00365BBE83